MDLGLIVFFSLLVVRIVIAVGMILFLMELLRLLPRSSK